LSTFKALADTWQLPEIKDWHKHLGDFWGPIIRHRQYSADWMPVTVALETGWAHGYSFQSDEEKRDHWVRGSCEVNPESPVALAFRPILEQVRLAYNHADFEVQFAAIGACDTKSLCTDEISGRLEIDQGPDWESTIVDSGKIQLPSVQWVPDFERLIEENREKLRTALQTEETHMQELLEEMVDKMKSIWQVATEEQKALWNEYRRQTFGTQELSTKLLDVVCSFESRWIPQEHCACPICWENGSQQRFSSMPDFVNHMKNTHHIGWKNVKDYWCMIFTKALGKCVYRRLTAGAPQPVDEEMGNAYAWCPYPKCKHSQDKGGSF
jgi:hypothetical protein